MQSSELLGHICIDLLPFAPKLRSKSRDEPRPDREQTSRGTHVSLHHPGWLDCRAQQYRSVDRGPLVEDREARLAVPLACHLCRGHHHQWLMLAPIQKRCIRGYEASRAQFRYLLDGAGAADLRQHWLSRPLLHDECISPVEHSDAQYYARIPS